MSLHIIHFATSITSATAEALRNTCLQAIQKNARSIQININSDGGGTLPAFGLYGLLRSLPVPIHTHNMGNVESMAVLLYLAGKRRTCASHGRFLIHPLHWGFNAGPVDIVRLSEYAARLQDDLDRYVQIFDERTQGAQQRLDVRPHLSGNHQIINGAAAIACGLVTDSTTEIPAPAEAVHWLVSSDRAGG